MGKVIVIEPKVTDDNKERNRNELKEVLRQIALSLSQEQLEYLDKLNEATKEITPKEIIRC